MQIKMCKVFSRTFGDYCRYCVLNRDACAYLGQGCKASSEGTHAVCIYVFLHRDRFWSSKSFPKEQCFVYWSPSNRMAIWGSGGLPTEKFS